MAEHIVAIYANDASADAAMQDLEGAGIPVSDIRRYRPHSADEMVSGTPDSSIAPSRQGGFWAWLTGEEVGPEFGAAFLPTGRRTVSSERSGR